MAEPTLPNGNQQSLDMELLQSWFPGQSHQTLKIWLEYLNAFQVESKEHLNALSDTHWAQLMLPLSVKDTLRRNSKPSNSNPKRLDPVERKVISKRGYHTKLFNKPRFRFYVLLT